MRAVVVTQPNEFGIQDIPKPVISEYEALIRIEVCGICNTTDWKLIDGSSPLGPRYPLVLGHESVGVVDTVGAKVISYKPGDRVTRAYAIYPGEGEGLYSGFGGMAEYGLVRDAQALAQAGEPHWLSDYTAQRQVVVPPDIEPLHASLAISLSECASWLLTLGDLAYQRVAVLGTGIAGLSFTYFAKLFGAKQVITLGRRESRLELARQVGADATLNTTEDDLVSGLTDLTEGEKVDLLIEAVGLPPLIADLWPALAETARVAVYAAPSDPTYTLPLATGPGDISFSRHAPEEHCAYSWVCDLLRRGLVPTDKLATHTWPLEEVGTAFEQVRAREVVKGFLIISS